MSYFVTGGLVMLFTALVITVVIEMVFYFGFEGDYIKQINNNNPNSVNILSNIKFAQAFISGGLVVYVLLWGGFKGIRHALK